MDRERIIAALMAYEAVLRSLGVNHVALFGSRARGDHNETSDIDIMLDLDPTAHLTIFDIVGIRDHLQDVFAHPVDVVTKGGLKAAIAPHVEQNAFYAF